MTPNPASRRQTHPRLAAAVAIGAAVAMVASACGTPLPDPVPGQSPAAYSGLEVSEDRIEYAIGKVTDIVEEELEASGVPGAAVAVVHSGEVALAEGFGVRSTETGESVDARTVRRIAHLARIAVSEEEVAPLQGELNAILAFVEQLGTVDVSGVEPMTSVTPMAMKKRADVVTDGERAADVVANAPETEDNYFLVPKVVE